MLSAWPLGVALQAIPMQKGQNPAPHPRGVAQPGHHTSVEALLATPLDQS
jgi:hypothetical protein